MKAALGLMGVAGFPYQLSPLKTKTVPPIPAFRSHRCSAKPYENLQHFYVQIITQFIHLYRGCRLDKYSTVL